MANARSVDIKLKFDPTDIRARRAVSSAETCSCTAAEPTRHISPRILTGRFERKILVGNPNAFARRNLIIRQLSQEIHEPMLSAEDMRYIIGETSGRSAVNLERASAL